MTHTLKSVLFVLLITITVQPAQGQRFLKKLQEKVEEKVEEKVQERTEKKTDEVIDKQLDKIENALEDEQNSAGESKDHSGGNVQNEQRMENILKGLGMSGEPVPVSDSYSFNHLIEMQVESFGQGGEKLNEGQFITHVNPETNYLAYEVVSGDLSEQGKGIFIIDAKNGATIILGDENGEKTGVVYGMGAFFSSIGESYEEAEPDETPENFLAQPHIKKPGRTKNIAGYKCEQYLYNDETEESEIWITKDMKLNTRDFFSTLFKTNLYSRGIPWGYMMEATTVDKETGEKSYMQVTRVEENSHVRYTLSDYKITNLGSLQMPAE